MFSLVYDPLWPREMLQSMRREWAALVHPFVMFSFVSALVQLLMNEERGEHLYPFSVMLSAHAVLTHAGL